MKHPDHTLKQISSLYVWMTGAVVVLTLLFAAPASAAYEQVGTFGGEEIQQGKDNSVKYSQFKDAWGMAVNVTGAGGVPPGTLWVARGGFSLGVPNNEPPSFIEYFNHFGLPFFGPKGEFLGESTSSGARPHGIAVDQSTGNVYLLTESGPNQKGVIQVYSPDGSQLITSFGEQGSSNEPIDKSPEKVHTISDSGIAVDTSGTVYVSDGFGIASRIMVFEPQSPGDYEHYVDTGRAHDIGVGTPYAGALALDSAGNLYVVSENNAIYEFAPGEPTTPVCEFQRPSGGIQGMTVNPKNGEVFYFTYKDKKIHQLSACNSLGEFVESISYTPLPKSEEIRALAINPSLAWEASRPPGILYAADSEENKPQHAEPQHADVFAPAKVFPPEVESQSASLVTSTTATLGAQINPKGSETRYVFQYLTKAAYDANEPAERFVGAAEAPLGSGALGAGQKGLAAAVSLVGLQSDTEYRYRVIATSHCDPEKEEVCEDTGSAQAFRTFPLEVPGLPDNRAWELVSPAQKNSGQVIPAQPNEGSCPTEECKPAALTGAGGYPMQSAPSGEAIVYEGFPFSATEGAAIFNQYLSKRTASGWQTTILSPRLHSGAYRAFNTGLTQGLLFQSNGPTLSPEAPPGYNNLYTQPTASPSALTPLMTAEPPNRNPRFIYVGASTDFSRLFFEADDALTGETPFAPKAVDGGVGKNNLYEWAGGELSLVNVAPGNAETAPGAAFGFPANTPASINANLSHAISDDGSRVFWSSESGQVYVREDGESTTAIPDPGKFLTAAADGSEVLLLNGHLYDLEAKAIADLTEGEGGFKGIAGQSEDLSQIYFVDTAVLSGEEENDHGAKAQSGKFNLYAWDEGAVAFIATLVPGDSNEGGVDGRGDWLASPSKRTAEASPGGRWLAFLSKAPLTGYDNTGPCPEKAGEVSGSCPEVFLYDSALGKLTCPSCNPSGTRPLGWSTLRLIQSAEGSLPQPRYLLGSGRLYFDTRDSLTPFDTNRGVEDVYQYEPQGVGDCKREGGCVSLISAGREPVDSNFLAVDETGKNVFFTSRDRLVKKDFDDLIDLYVAREGGGIAEEIDTECQGEACQPAVIAPNDPTPAFEGAGNLTQRPNASCAKGKVRKRGRCVKKRSHKRSHGRAAKRNRGGVR